MRSKVLFFYILVVLTFVLSSCDIIPSDFNFGINANVAADVDIETTSDLGEDTLERIDAVNETIANGFEVGPETRKTIDELNQTIKNGVKAGFDDKTLARVDELLRVVEDGLKIGLDSDTLNTIDGMVDTIDAMPGKWENSAEDIIRTLENSAGTAAAKMAKEVKGIMNEARLNYQQMTAVTGIEFRCNVDFLGSKAGATVQEFIGKSIVGKIRQIVSGKPLETDILPTPWVCQVIPDKIVLSKVGDRLLYEEGVILLTGYNYVQGNTPQASILDENGQLVTGFHLPVYRTSPYQLQMNLQELDLSAVPARSRLVVIFPNAAETSGIAILLPASLAPIASFKADPMAGSAPLSVQFTDLSANNPTQWEWVFSDGATSNERNPSHTYLKGGSFDVRLTASNNQGSSSVTQIISVDVPLTADFTFSPNRGNAPLVVNFKDQSMGSPTSWLWDFGDGQTSDLPNPQHVFTQPKPEGHQVRLTVSNVAGSSEKTSPDRVLVMSPVIAGFSQIKSSGMVPLTVNFIDQSQGDITAWKWDFGDGSLPSYEKNPSHTYSKSGLMDVSLTVTRSDGETNTVVKNGAVNVQRIMMTLAWKMPEQSIYFTTYEFNLRTRSPVDTGIPYDKYVCGISGYQISGGMIYGETIYDPLSAYAYKSYNANKNIYTWWLTASFPTGATHVDLGVVCLNRSMEGKLFTYRDDFKNIQGGKAFETDLLTSNYFSCNIAGYQALGPAQFQGYGEAVPVIQNVVVQGYMDGSGTAWKIMVDLPLKEQEKWNVNVLCFKRSDTMLVENPPLMFGEVTILGGGNATVPTGYSPSNYMCGIGGFLAERGDIKMTSPDLIIPMADDPLVMVMKPVNGLWNVSAEFGTGQRDEDWRVKYWCARKPYAVEGTPPKQ
jgi:PKD repeat protein